MAQKKQPKRKSMSVSASLPLDLVDEVDCWRERQRVRVGRSAMIKAALKEFMANHPPEGEPCSKCSGQPTDGGYNGGFYVEVECLTCGRKWEEPE